jgi:hypothetical protein
MRMIEGTLATPGIHMRSSTVRRHAAAASSCFRETYAATTVAERSAQTTVSDSAGYIVARVVRLVYRTHVRPAVRFTEDPVMIIAPMPTGSETP